MLAVALALSILGLLVGPALGRWASGRSRALVALDAATLALVSGVILLRLMPHLIEDAGASALIGFALGYVLLQLVEARSHGRSTTLGLVVVLPALAIHAFFDGAALGVALSNNVLGSGGAMLAVALLVHRVPEGLFLASAMTALGIRRVRWGIVVIAIATVIGALAGRELLHHHSGDFLHVAVAVGLGMMLRLVVHRHDVVPAPDSITRRIGGITFVGCLALVVFVPSPELLWQAVQPQELSIAEALVPLFLETSLVVLALLVVAEIVARVARVMANASDPWMTTSVLGGWMLGPCLAVLIALASRVGDVGRRRDPTLPWWRVFAMPRAGSVLPSYCVGVLLAVMAEAALPPKSFEGLGLVVAPLAAVIGATLRFGLGAPLLAAILLHKGAPLSAVAAFLIAAGTREWARRHGASIRTAVVASSVGLGFILAPVLDRCAIVGLHEVGRHAHSVVEWVGAGILGAWIVLDLASTGPRGWLQRDRHAVTAISSSPTKV